MRHLYELSQGHPSYLQRAAFHLFIHKLNAEYDWVRAYLAEVRATPIPGAPLPPPVFAGADELAKEAFAPDNGSNDPPTLAPPTFEIDEPHELLVYVLPLLLAGLLFLATSNPWLTATVAVIGLAAIVVIRHRRNAAPPPS